MALKKEFDSLNKNGVWTVVDLPKDRKSIGNNWVSAKETQTEKWNATKQD